MGLAEQKTPWVADGEGNAERNPARVSYALGGGQVGHNAGMR